MYDKYTKVVEAEFPRLMMHATIPMGAPLAVVFDHYRLQRHRVSEFRKHINLFFLSGTGMTKTIWHYHIKRLFHYSETHPELPWQIVNCVAIDLVNHGDSAIENEGVLGWQFDWREGAHDLIQVAKALRLTGDNVVVGHSMGGFQAVYSTLISPMMFKFVISIEPVIWASETGGEVFEGKILPALAGAIRTEFKNEKEYETYMRKYSFYKKFNKEILDEFIQSEKVVHIDGTVSAKTSKEIQLICYHAGIRIFPLGLNFIKSSEVPIVLVTGGSATWTPKETMQAISDSIRKGERIDIPDGEHLVNGEMPDEIIEVILKSLSKYIAKKGDDEHKKVIGKEEYKKTFQENYQLVSKAFRDNKSKSKL